MTLKSLTGKESYTSYDAYPIPVYSRVLVQMRRGRQRETERETEQRDRTERHVGLEREREREILPIISGDY